MKLVSIQFFIDDEQATWSFVVSFHNIQANINDQPIPKQFLTRTKYVTISFINNKN